MTNLLSILNSWVFRLAILAWIAAAAAPLGAQEQRKARISNAGYTITASPLLAAKEWEFFTANGFDTELTLKH